jgi:5'-methylthioadenosine phosphorylase
METNISIIGGSQAYELLRQESLGIETEVRVIDTPYGTSSPLHKYTFNGQHFWFLSRHGEKGYELSAPFVNYRANIWALREIGTERIIAWSGPGIINPEYKVGSFVLPHDLIDETRGRPSTFYEKKGLGFIRQSEPFCPQLREGLSYIIKQLGLPYYLSGVYICTQGPRLETPAEIRKYRIFGADLVGMTLVPEAFLARELEMCYAPICYLTNYAEGVIERPYQPGTLFEGMQTREESKEVKFAIDAFPDIIRALVDYLKDKERYCSCPQAMLRYKKQGIIGEDWHDWVAGT